MKMGRAVLIDGGRLVPTATIYDKMPLDVRNLERDIMGQVRDTKPKDV
jgi:hypothetical protein